MINGTRLTCSELSDHDIALASEEHRISRRMAKQFSNELMSQIKKNIKASENHNSNEG